MPQKRVALVMALRDGLLLMGRREDNGRWTLPGGGLNEGEDPVVGARRELHEETGLEPDGPLELVDERELGTTKIYTFQCEVKGTPTGKHDPDGECRLWSFFDVAHGIPKAVAENMAGPRDPEDNVAADLVGLEKMQRLVGFPQLGIEDRRETPYLSTKQQVRHKVEQMASFIRPHLRAEGGTYLSPEDRTAGAREYGMDTLQGAHGAVATDPAGRRINRSFANSNGIRNLLHPTLSNSNTSDVATKAHEDFHQMMSRVEYQFGRAARLNLAHNLWHSVPLADRSEAQLYAGVHNRQLRGQDMENEEHLAILHNYLNDPAERHQYHKYMSDSTETAQWHGTKIKRAFKAMNENAGKANHSWLTDKRFGPGAKPMPALPLQVPSDEDRAPAAPAELPKPKRVERPGGMIMKSCSLAPWEVELEKMAIKDIPRGQRIPGAPNELAEREYDYSHVLPAHLRNEYKIVVGATPSVRAFGATALHVPTGRMVGMTEAFGNSPYKGSMYFETADLNPEHQGKGVGKALYEATLAHGYHTGHREVHGGAHSEDARRVHEALARKHGLVYVPQADKAGDWNPEHERWVDDEHPNAPYRHVLKSELAKQEHADEVERLLNHPNPAERTLALKLAGVRPHHLSLAFLDQDPAVQRQALQHPAVDHQALLDLMQAGGDPQVPLEGLQHPLATRDHLEALYDTLGKDPRVVHSIGQSSLLDGPLIERMIRGGHGLKVVDNLHTPPNALAEMLEQHLKSPNDPDRQALARRAVRHPSTPPHLVAEAFKSGSPNVKIAAVMGPHLPEDLVQDVLARGRLGANDHEAFLRSVIVTAPKTTRRHLETAKNDRNPVVSSAAKARLQNPMVKFERDLAGWLTQRAPEALAKSREDAQGPRCRHVVAAQLGHSPRLHRALAAARWLRGGGENPARPVTRQALWDADGDHHRAALLAHGFEASEANLKALKGYLALQPAGEPLKKGENPSPDTEVQPVLQEGRECAEEVQEAFKGGFVVQVDLGGEHSQGSMLARAQATGRTWLLKPAVNPDPGPAAGSREQVASQPRREAAFYHLADAWGLGEYCPRTELLLIGSREYAAIELLPWRYHPVDSLKDEDPEAPRRLFRPYLDQGVLHRWGALDAVAGNPDRNLNNVMSPENPGPGDGVRLIDHGAAFAGVSFDPAHDQNSFVPGYLRAWAPPEYRDLPPDQQFKVLPRLGRQLEEGLRAWVDSLHAEDVDRILIPYGVDPTETLSRLARLKAAVETQGADEAVLGMWVQP